MFPVALSSIDRRWRHGEGQNCRNCSQLFVHCPGYRLDDDARFCPVQDSALCDKCTTKCCRFTEVRDKELTQIGGLGWEKHKSYPGLKLPAIVWRLHRSNWGLDLSAVSIPGRLLLTINGSWAREKDLRRRFQIPDKTLVGVDWFVHDPILDVLAEKSAKEFVFQMKNFAPDFMVAPDFASYSNHPSLSNSLNLKRRTQYARAIAEAGIPVIPDVSHSHPIERQRLMDECGGHPYAAISYQTARLRSDLDCWEAQVVNQVGFFQKLNSAPVWVGCHGKRAKIVLQSFPESVLLDTRVYRLSEFKKNLDGDKVFSNRREAWAANTKSYAERVSKWKAQAVKR